MFKIKLQVAQFHRCWFGNLVVRSDRMKILSHIAKGEMWATIGAFLGSRREISNESLFLPVAFSNIRHGAHH
jgi:hypothetical protein